MHLLRIFSKKLLRALFCLRLQGKGAGHCLFFAGEWLPASLRYEALSACYEGLLLAILCQSRETESDPI